MKYIFWQTSSTQGGVQGQVRRVLEQPGLLECCPAHRRWLELHDYSDPFQTKPLYGTVILWFIGVEAV